MRRADLLEKTLMLGKFEGKRRIGQQRVRWLDSITDSMHMNLVNSGRWWRTGKHRVLQSMGSQRVIHNLATEQQNILWWPSVLPSFLMTKLIWSSLDPFSSSNTRNLFSSLRLWLECSSPIPAWLTYFQTCGTISNDTLESLWNYIFLFPPHLKQPPGLSIIWIYFHSPMIALFFALIIVYSLVSSQGCC